MSGSVVVLGAGIVGTCCALALQRQGLRVRLIDRCEPGLGCSFGNAGMIQTGAVLPLAVPGILKRVPRMLFDPNGPLVLNWTQLPRLLPWLITLLQNANPVALQRTAAALSALLKEAKGAYRRLSDGSAAPALFKARGELYVFASDSSYAALASRFQIYRQHSVEYVELSGSELKEIEPHLSARYERGYYLPDSEYVVNPLLLTQSLAKAFTSAGGTLMRADVRSLQHLSNGEVILKLDAGEIEADRLVIAAGFESGALAKAFGLDIPVEPLRGYHVMMLDDGVKLSGPVIEGDMNIAALPMPDGIRIAGTLEFAGHRSAPRWGRADMLSPLAKTMLPEIRGEASERWYGYRPSMPDSLPVLGLLPGHSNVWCAFGHGQLGLTLAGISGQLIAEMVTGQAPSVDVVPFQPGRFRTAA